MKRLLPLLALVACGDDSTGGGNPSVLWLAPFMSETEVQLQPTEPPPF
ncbi:MAG: hypothetical protein QM831_39020 [Kofleriaceae bacterium]